ncbi:MAG: RAD55 family ATPase [Candidatus Nanohaloarchaea archaeon]
MQRIETGIRNFDNQIEGGIPHGETVLIEGEPGAGKTNFGIEFLYRGAMEDQNGLFVSFQETEDEILRTTTFDWDFEEYVESGTINIRKMNAYRYEEVADMLRGMIKVNEAERIVLDPITDLDLYIDSRKDIRKTLLSIKKEVRNSEATALMLAETGEATSIEEEIADGIVDMIVEEDGKEVQRKLYIRKLKGSDYNQNVHNYSLDSKGLKVQ